MKDRLFMLRPGFSAGGRGPLYCGDCAAVEGLLGFFPVLRDKVAVSYIDAPRPRGEIVALLGPDHQSAPVLVLAPDRDIHDKLIAIKVSGERFIDDPAAINHYLSTQYGLPGPA